MPHRTSFLARYLAQSLSAQPWVFFIGWPQGFARALSLQPAAEVVCGLACAPQARMGDDHDHGHDVHFESADAGASLTYPQQAGTVRKNGFLVIKGRPCKVRIGAQLVLIKAAQSCSVRARTWDLCMWLLSRDTYSGCV